MPSFRPAVAVASTPIQPVRSSSLVPNLAKSVGPTVSSESRSQSMIVNPVGIAAVNLSSTTESKSIGKSGEIDLEQRAELLGEFGPLETVVPTPGFVLKTRRLEGGTKVFVNICSHKSIPIGIEVASGEGKLLILVSLVL
jgi:hypothetical protein